MFFAQNSSGILHWRLPMFKSAKEMTGLSIEAVDGAIGRVEQFLFDDRNWAVRYLVIDIGLILVGRRVLLSPASVEAVLEDVISVRNSKEQVRTSPEIDTARPLSSEREVQLHDYYSWPYYWDYPINVNSLGGLLYPEHASPYASFKEKRSLDAIKKDERMESQTRESHLRETKEIRGYHIQALDEQIGHVEDYILDINKWVIRYFVVETRNFLPGKKVLIAPQWIKGIDWGEAVVYADVSQEEIRNSPLFDSTKPLTREFEEKLYKYYNRNGYWEREKE